MRSRPVAIIVVVALALALGWPTAASAAGPTAGTTTVSVDDAALRDGETSTVTFTFAEPMLGFDNADITVENGTLTTVSTGDNITWTATFTPAPNTTDSANVITVDLGGVTDLLDDPGTGTATSNTYAIDTERPTATVVVADTALTAGETTTVTFTFSEAVTGFTNADLTLENGTLTTVSSADGGITWTATFTPAAGVTDTTNVITLDQSGVADAAGNPGTGTATSNTYAIDTERPTATVVVADTALTAGETTTVTFTFSEAVTGFTNADLTLENGTLTTVSSSDGGITWTATFSPAPGVTDTTNVITLDQSGVADAAGNPGTGTATSNTYAIDTQRPGATVVVADTALTAGETTAVTVTFNEAVTGLTNADLTLENGTLTTVSSADGGITWTATFTPAAGVTDTTNVITLDQSGVADAAGNAGTGTATSNTYAIDTQRPTATVVAADTALTAGETTAVTVTFSEAVTGLTTADITVPNGTLSSPTSSDGGITWTATFTPNAGVVDNSNVFTLDLTGVSDAAGNAGTGTTNSANFTINTTRPSATVVVTDSDLSIGETTTVTVTFSEAVSGLSNADLTIDNGTLTAVSTSDGGITWTATLTPAAGVTDPTNAITLDVTGVQNAGGNTGVGTVSSNNYAVNAARPTGTVVVADTTLTAGETTTVTVTFSEAVSGFGNTDLAAANGTLSTVTSSDGGITWTATLTPAAGVDDTTNVITLDLSGVQNPSGNAGVGATDSNNYAVITSALTLTITVDDTAVGSGETSLVTFRFSRAVTGFSNADVTVSGGTLAPVASTDGGVTFTATFTPTANTTSAGNMISVDLAGVTDSATGAPGTGVSASNVFVVDTAAPANPVDAVVRVLAATGADIGGILSVGALLLLLGSALLVVRRRRA